MNSFEEFWPFYLSQHQNKINRSLHIVGTTAGLILLIFFIAQGHYGRIILCPIVGYFFAWIGHFGFEKNRPATFKYPGWSFKGDFVMLKLFYTGKLNQELGRLGLN